MKTKTFKLVYWVDESPEARTETLHPNSAIDWLKRFLDEDLYYLSNEDASEELKSGLYRGYNDELFLELTIGKATQVNLDGGKALVVEWVED